jgi:hypothetical protein
MSYNLSIPKTEDNVQHNNFIMSLVSLTEYIHLFCKVKGKAIPVTGCGDP